MKRKQNNFGAKYGNEENITEKSKSFPSCSLNKMENELELLEEGPKAKIHIDSLRGTLQKVPN